MDTFFQILIYHGEVRTFFHSVHCDAHACVRCEEVEMCALTLGADGGSVEEGWLSGDARVRELQTPPSGPGGRRSGAAPHALPDAALHRHRTRRQPGDLSHLIKDSTSTKTS